MVGHKCAGSNPSASLKHAAFPSRSEQMNLSRLSFYSAHSPKEHKLHGIMQQSLLQTAKGRRCLAVSSLLLGSQ